MSPSTTGATLLSFAELRVLRAMPSEHQLIRPGALGASLWGKDTRPPHAYARPVSAVLNRLRGRGLVDWRANSEDWGWYRTAAGDAAVARGESR